jgi:hypothetical protein
VKIGIDGFTNQKADGETSLTAIICLSYESNRYITVGTPFRGLFGSVNISPRIEKGLDVITSQRLRALTAKVPSKE